MKIFHTADWHLGKIVHGSSMLKEQEYMIDQFTERIREEKPDVIIIAGDLYDRANPPTEAVELLNDFLDEIVLALNIPVIAIAGNHDSPARVHFGSKLMRERGFYIVGQLEENHEPIRLATDVGDVYFHLVPFVDPSVVRTIYDDEEIRTYDDAMEAIVKRIKSSMDDRAHHILVSHYFVTPEGKEAANTSDSERVLSIGGIEYVDAGHLVDFNYVALGHLHRAHAVGANHIRYAGSPLKYSISEENHEKGFYEVNLAEDGSVSVEKQVLTPRRDMRTVEGKLEDILQMEPSDDYIFVQLLDRSPVLSPMEQVRTVFPNTLHLERLFDQFIPTEKVENRVNKTKQTDLELFTSFYEEVRGFPPEDEKVTIFKEVVDELLQADID